MKALVVEVVLLLLFCLRGGEAISIIEPCSSSVVCEAFVSYTLPGNLRVRDVASLFGIDSSLVVGSNDIDLSLSDLENLVLPSGKALRLPQSCACVNGLRQTSSASYSVRAGDTLTAIADTFYQGLASPQQIAAANNLTNSGTTLPVGTRLVVPFPCSCGNGTDLGLPAYFLAYPLKKGESLASVAANFSTNAAHLASVNTIANASSVRAGDVIQVPLPACTSSFNQGATDQGLSVARGMYIITAGTCIQCSCGNGSTEVYCTKTPDAFSGSCSSLNCAGTNLSIGQFSTKNESGQCVITSCLYNGYAQSGILTVLQTTQNPTCPAPPSVPSLYKPPTGLAASPLAAPSSGAPAKAPTSSSSSSTVSPSSPSSTLPSQSSSTGLLPGSMSPANGPASSHAYQTIPLSPMLVIVPFFLTFLMPSLYIIAY